ncbi:hypothetical protein FDUTEX481_01911 [Tolypothrix sp. PCC 7601]|nr:hypothetical protein FDUTEX481_01911 [Tolypothrix sp. PCC 7601]
MDLLTQKQSFLLGFLPNPYGKSFCFCSFDSLYINHSIDIAK